MLEKMNKMPFLAQRQTNQYIFVDFSSTRRAFALFISLQLTLKQLPGIIFVELSSSTNYAVNISVNIATSNSYFLR